MAKRIKPVEVDLDTPLIVTPLLERELGAKPTLQEVEQWRRRTTLTADPSTVLGALLSKLDGLSVEHAGVRATIRWLGSTVYAGEKAIFVLMELSSAAAHAVVLELERGYDRVLTVPAAPDARERVEDLLRHTLEECGVDAALPEAHFLGTVAEFVGHLPGRLVASPPPASLGRWVLEEGIADLLGDVGELPLPRGQRLTVHVRRDESSLQPAKDGVWFAPMVALRRTGARGKVLGETEQQISLAFLGIDTMYEPLPGEAHQRAARAALRRWKAQLARRIARLPSADGKSLMPMDLPWPTPPLELAAEALRRGPAGRRTGDPAS